MKSDRTVAARIHGRVQGVFFRHHTKLMADGLGLSGWVRNRPDGSVEALCSGSAESVRQMIDWLRVGPESALVDKIEITDLEDQDVVHDQFTIRY